MKKFMAFSFLLGSTLAWANPTEESINRAAQEVGNSLDIPDEEISEVSHGESCQIAPVQENTTEYVPSFVQAFSSPPPERRVVKFSGTAAFEACQEIIDGDWSVSIKKRPLGEQWDYAWYYPYEDLTKEGDDAIGKQARKYRNAWVRYHQLVAQYLDSLDTPTPLPPPGAAGLWELGDTLDHFQGFVGKVSRKAAQIRQKVYSCLGVAVITASQDYGDSKVTSGGTYPTSDKKVECKGQGAETVDYPPCIKAVDAYSISQFADLGVQIYQGISFQDFAFDQQMELIMAQQQGDADVRAPFEAQARALDEQGSLARQRSLLDGGKMALFHHMRNKIPRPQEVQNRCFGGSVGQTCRIDFQANEFIYGPVMSFVGHIKQYSPGVFSGELDAYNDYTKVVIILPDGTLDQREALIPRAVPTYEADNLMNARTARALASPGRDENPWPKEIFYYQLQGDPTLRKTQTKALCSDLLAGEDFEILNNQGVRDGLKLEMMRLGITLGANLIKGNILNAQAQRIRNASMGIEEFEPIPLAVSGEDLLNTLCVNFPDHPQCSFLSTSDILGLPNQYLRIHGARPPRDRDTSLDDDRSDRASAGPHGRIPSPVGRPLVRPMGARNGDSLETAPGSGKITTAQAPSQSASGGNNSSGAAAPPTGGGNSGDDSRPRRIPPARQSTLGHQRGRPPASITSGTGRTKDRPSDKVPNPFKNLANKGDANKIQFRNLASVGSSDSDLFARISHRYQSVSRQERLLAYEPVDDSP